ncbi:MAG: hypothetical protein IJ120_02690 [Solobacterium sp.]|nr:hypothetical protein [Solobacterium sp.]
MGIHKGRYRARITLRRKDIYLGEFDTYEQAVQARVEAERKYFDPIREAYNAEKGTYRNPNDRTEGNKQ